MRILPLIAFAFAPTLAFAAGSGSSTAPKPSESVQQCTEGLVFDLATQTCMTPEQSTNDDQARMDDIRSLSHFGRHADALALLATMADQADPMVLTYYGFVTRKMGDLQTGLAYYDRALAIDPDFHLARSYMGQAHVEAGNLMLARAALTEMQMRGARGTWPETSLAGALRTGRTYTH